MSAVLSDNDTKRELERLCTLARYDIVDTPADAAFDDLVALAADLFDTPIAVVTLIEHHRNFFKAHVGFDPDYVEEDRASSFCTHTIESDDVMVVHDAQADVRFRQNRHVTGGMQVRFYAGAPIVAPDGSRIGTVCVIDRKPHAFSEREERLLSRLASLAMLQIERHAETRARDGERAFLSTIVEHIPASVFVKDAVTHEFLLLNKACETMVGAPRGEVLGRTDFDLFDPAEAEGFVAADDAVMASRAPATFEEQLHTPTGLSRVLRTHKVGIYNEAGDPRFLLGIAEDITSAKHYEALLSHMARHDELTDLPNRVHFTQRLSDEIARPRDAGSFAVHAIDLDRFKHVNETHGFPVGDRILQLVASRLRQCAGEGDEIARFSGDELSVLQVDVGSIDDVVRYAARLVTELGRPFDVDGVRITVGASIGTVMARAEEDSAERMLRHADLALQSAKLRGRGSYELFDVTMDSDAADRSRLEGALSQAVERDELVLHLQPVVRASDRSVVGYEALVRWQHPQRGLLPPGEFIGLAEETGLIHAIGEWVLEHACHAAASRPGRHSISVNLSPLQFRRAGLVGSVRAALARASLPPERLTLEITESLLMQDTASTLRQLDELRRIGVKLAIDDFGTGYSSLAYLRSFAVDQIKIDRSFVRDVAESADDAAIVRAILSLAHDLGVIVVAEGVETEAQLAFLREGGCELIQGYLTGAPAPMELALSESA